MKGLILGRLAQSAFSLLMLTAIIFVLVRLTGDPVQVLLPDAATPEMHAELTRELGLDQSLLVQYQRYLGSILIGDFGRSHRTGSPVIDLIAERLPATLQLGVVALLICFCAAIPLGVYAAYWRGGLVDGLARASAVLGQSVPVFWLGLLFIMVFAVWLRMLPAGGREEWQHVVLPALTLAWVSMGGIIRLMRSSMVETLSADYVTFARVKGLSERRVVWKHALRNAAIPVLTFGGTLSAQILTGSVVTETVFAWPGLGRLMVDSITARDFPVVQGAVLLLGAMYLLINLAVDVLYLYLNPRLRR